MSATIDLVIIFLSSLFSILVFQECGNSPSIWAVKFHTSEQKWSGTDNSVKMIFKIYQWIDNNGTKTIEDLDECQTNDLNNAGNDRERGQTDIYTAKQLGERISLTLHASKMWHAKLLSWLYQELAMTNWRTSRIITRKEIWSLKCSLMWISRMGSSRMCGILI